MRLVVGTRGSALALAQTDLVRRALLARFPGLEIETRRITTKGDVLLDRPLGDVGDKGLFVAEIEEALRRGEIDLAVHSAKDLPSDLPADLCLAAFPERADPRDVLVSRLGGLADLPPGARVGTGSPRRACQVRAARPDLAIVPIRGNVDTRLRKLDAGDYDALVLAAAGLVRLGWANRVTEWLPLEVALPSVGQGALAVETRAEDTRVRELVGALDDPVTARTVRAERAFLSRMGAGCQAAVAAHAVAAGAELVVTGMIGHPDGRMVTGRATGFDPVELGTALADRLLVGGGRALLEECRHEREFVGD
ncbi:MAG TPA: hydroxymethylbilane synthase [Gemmatimonadales bacterium]|nr:hydroxymethylbilane synthase [Gemmatimonadales bacterium]